VATVAIGGAQNAALLAAAILALSDAGLRDKLKARRREMREKVLAAVRSCPKNAISIRED